MKRRALAAVAVALLVTAAGSTERAAPAGRDAADDVRVLMDGIRRTHPDPFHATPEPVFQAAADELACQAPSLSPDEMLVGLVRLLALLGERDGHSGIFPLDLDHRRDLHLYPLLLYQFSDGLFVVSSPAHPDLVGARLLAIDGKPVAELAAKVRPLVPRDNESTRDDRFSEYLLTAEVLHGLGLRADTGPARFTFQGPNEAPRDVVLAPVTAGSYLEDMRADFPSIVYALPHRAAPYYLRRRGESLYVTGLRGGRVIYVGYNLTRVDTHTVARTVLRLARRRKVQKVVVDVRLNPGGDNHTYVPLLNALRAKRINKRGRLIVLMGRSTFSAAQNFITEVERKTRVTFVGEESGGSPNLYGDAASIQLPSTGWHVNIATTWWVKSRRDDPRVAIEPNVPVSVSSTDFFAGRDTALGKAIAYRAP